jgi:hypothetical protein
LHYTFCFLDFYVTICFTSVKRRWEVYPSIWNADLAAKMPHIGCARNTGWPLHINCDGQVKSRGLTLGDLAGLGFVYH